MRRKSFFILAFSCCVSVGFAQEKEKKEGKNVVSFNLTNPLIFGEKAFVLGYERVVKKHQSFSINIGRMALPSFSGAGTSSLTVQRNRNDKGFHFGTDYRFYLAKENKHNAPRGVYIGPYYSYNSFSRSNDWVLNTSSFNGVVNTTTSLKINTVGAQLGYQFIFWKRIALDLILLGPGLSVYEAKANINSNLSAQDQELFYQQLNDFLKEKIPGYNLAIGEGSEFKKNGSMNITSIGYRYMINIGIKF
ncbi:MAG: hypothetical protein RL596_333 [Bacteroidota bacterium]|jgi:hypothetical protein